MLLLLPSQLELKAALYGVQNSVYKEIMADRAS